MTRWTKPRADGKPHSYSQECECAMCPQRFRSFDVMAIVTHCRQFHREFYREHWEREIASNPVLLARNKGWEPLS